MKRCCICRLLHFLASRRSALFVGTWRASQSRRAELSLQAKNGRKKEGTCVQDENSSNNVPKSKTPPWSNARRSSNTIPRPLVRISRLFLSPSGAEPNQHSPIEPIPASSKTSVELSTEQASPPLLAVAIRRDRRRPWVWRWAS